MQRRFFTKARIKSTKNDMARVIVQALYRLPTLPAADNVNVKRRERLKKAQLEVAHKQALKIINDELRAGTWPTEKRCA